MLKKLQNNINKIIPIIGIIAYFASMLANKKAKEEISK